PLFEDGPGPGLEPVGGEFQPSFETGYAGGGAHLIFKLKNLLQFYGFNHILDSFILRVIRQRV
ncbi:MAG: hypothetical protein PVJ00_09785, partial [Desulfobacterales bacterium]